MTKTIISNGSTIHQPLRVLTGLMALIALAACEGDHPTAPGDDPVQQTGWYWQNPLPQGNHLSGVSFTDANTGTAVGGNGAILRTTDGGITWVSQTSGTTENLNGVSFTDANTGTVVGSGGAILRTTDGGDTWGQPDERHFICPSGRQLC